MRNRCSLPEVDSNAGLGPSASAGGVGFARFAAERNGRLAEIAAVLTRERSAGFDPLTRRARHPLAVLGAAAFAATLCGAFLHPRAFVFAAGLATVMVLGVVWPWLSVRGLRGRLSFDRSRVREGESLTWRLSVSNRLPWGTWGLVVRGAVEARRDGLEIEAPSLALAVGRGTTEVCGRVAPACRGEYPRALRLATAFPFGVWESARPLTVTAPVLVWPRTFPVGPVPEAVRGREGEGSAVRSRPGVDGDPSGVREYRRGDSLRRVHWPQTARHGRLIVQELHALAVARVQIVLDADPRVHVGAGPAGSLEWAVRIAASFAEGWVGQGADLELVFGDRLVAPTAGSIRSRRASLLDALARLCSDGVSALADVLDGPACRRFGEGLRVVVATDLGLSTGRSARPGAGCERFVVLQAAAFGGPPIEPSVLKVRPWIWVDDAERVPERVGSGAREVAFVG